jgi:hypothetical protein
MRGTVLESSRWATRVFALGAALLAGCVDPRIHGVSTSLLVASIPEEPLEPGESVVIAFQAVDDSGKGVQDQALEVLITDLSRLTFSSNPAANRDVVRTTGKEGVGGVLISGGAVLQFDVPKTAEAGSVSVVASLEGEKGASPKTQSVSLEIGEKGSGGAAGSGGSAGVGGAPGNDAGAGGVDGNEAGAAGAPTAGGMGGGP